MKEIIQQMARESGATDMEGNKAEDIFCFTKGELNTFVYKILTEVNNELDSDVAQEQLEKHFGSAFKKE